MQSTESQSAAARIARRERRYIVALTLLITALSGQDVYAENFCQADFHCHDGGKRFRAIAQYMTQEMRTNGLEGQRVAVIMPGPVKLAWWINMVRDGQAWDHKPKL